eukprot:TRINITY_DN29115_c0_g2_i1.p1 TRINITY_DN29115_c0_g2~~TRINITY_DN29115_c0_g2_i1.p1  ORF type:complete len:1606 (-),score=313.23 TRINITY_DN29115_c0_g2_i1:186-5003(-)
MTVVLSMRPCPLRSLLSLLAACLTAARNGSDLYRIDTRLPLFTDPVLRILADGDCSKGVPGSVAAWPGGVEIHEAHSRKWHWSDTGPLSCAETDPVCHYSSSKQAFWCQASPGGVDPDLLNCECQQCPCPAGLGGFACSACTDDTACGVHERCSGGVRLSEIDKPYTCRFSDAWRRKSSYKLFWRNGWAQPIAYVRWLPSNSTVQLDFIQSMCSSTQPVLFQCSCSDCSLHRDSVDQLTDEHTGVCAEKSIPSPCSKCEACTCNFPEESALGSLAKQIIAGVHGGVHVGCDGSGNTSRCVAVLDDLPMKLELDCEAGSCVDKNVTEPEAFVATSSLSWSATAMVCLASLFALSIVVLGYVALRGAWKQRLAAIAPLSEPGTTQAAPRSSAPLSLSWQGVSCMRAGRQVLLDVSGSIESSTSGEGRLVALVGPSGSGKTTLMEALAGQVTRGDKGCVAFNGQLLSPGARKNLVSFVRQDDIFGPLLTVREVIEFSAALRLRGLSAVKRAGRVSWTLKMLKLEAVADSRVGDAAHRGISGGERRRVAIGVEVVVSPAVMVLDEPTTGLDASSALLLGQTLAALAQDGRLLICSLHQPRPELLSLFHQTIRLGTASKEESEVVAAQSGENRQGAAHGERSETDDTKAEQSSPKADGELQGSTQATAGAAQDVAQSCSVASRAGFAVQVLELWRRSLLESLRGGRGDLWAAVVVTGVGVFIGYTFKDLNSGLDGVQNRFGSIFFVQLFFAFFGLQACASWYVDRPRFERETESRIYSSAAYVFAKAVSYLWWYCLLLPSLFVLVAYSLIGYRFDGPSKPLMYFLCVAGTMASSSGMSLLCLSSSESFGSGMSSSAILVTVMLMYSGFLQRRDAIPVELRWLVDISPFSHSFAAMMSNELGGLETTIDASGYQQVEIQGEIWLYQFDIVPDQLSLHAHALGTFAAAVWFLALASVWSGWYRVAAVPRLACLLNKRAQTYCAAESSACSVTVEPDEPVPVQDESFKPKAPGSLLWDDLQATLPSGKALYEGFSGVAQVGKPLAVLGPSGCGKTTLLSCLAGETQRVRWSGSVFLGNQEMTALKLSQVVGYVRQDDSLHSELTVSETIAFAAALRLSSASNMQQAGRVDWVLRRLGLQTVAKSRLGGEKCRGVSGGERRRTSVAVELVASRGVLVLDEPTSGLDEEAARALCGLLAELALEGCVVIASLHQPTDQLLSNFHDTLVLGPSGRVAYFGITADLGKAADAVSVKPRLTAAADYFLDLVSGEDADKTCHAYHGSAFEVRAREKLCKAKELCSKVTLPSPGTQSSTESGRMLPPLATQLRHLAVRELRIAIRDRTLARYHYGGALVAGLLLGFTYLQMPLNLSGVISRIGLFFAAECILATQALQGLMAWRQGHTCFVRERAAGYYSTGAFVCAKVAVDALMLRLGPAVLMCLSTYQLAGLAPGREAACCLGFCLASLASATFCLALGALAPRSRALLPVAVLLQLLFLLFGGILLSKAPRLLAYISYFRASYHLLVANEFRGQRFAFDPNGVEADFKEMSGEEWMRLLHIEDRAAAEQALWLIGWTLAYVVIAWAALALGGRRHRQFKKHVPTQSQPAKGAKEVQD